MVRITNVVCTAEFGVSIDLTFLAKHAKDIVYDPRHFSGVIWHHKKIGGSCLVFKNEKLNCNGNKSVSDAKRRIRQYARAIQQCGYHVTLKKIDIITMSAVHKLSNKVDLAIVREILKGTYEPEFFNAAMFKKGRLRFYCFRTGTVVITGIRNKHMLDDIVYSTMIELELCTHKKETVKETNNDG